MFKYFICKSKKKQRDFFYNLQYILTCKRNSEEKCFCNKIGLKCLRKDLVFCKTIYIICSIVSIWFPFGFGKSGLLSYLVESNRILYLKC